MISIKELDAEYPAEDTEAYEEAYAEVALSFEIAELVYNLRKQAKLTQAELAKRMKTTQSVIARMESGGHKPNLVMIERLAQALQVRIHLVAEPLSAPKVPA